MKMHRKISGCTRSIAIPGISHKANQSSCFHFFSDLEIFCIIREMCIIKISTSGSKDSNPVTAKFQPSKILNRSIGHTYDGIDTSMVNGGYDVDTFMTAFPSIGSFVLPGIFKGDGVVRTIGGCSNRKIPEIIPYGTAEFQVFVPVRKVFPVWFVFLYRKIGRFIRMIQSGKTGTKSVRICLKPSLKPVETKKLAIPRYSPAQLAAKAKKEGDAPDIVKDEITKVTLFDYSDIFTDDEDDDEDYYEDEV